MKKIKRKLKVLKERTVKNKINIIKRKIQVLKRWQIKKKIDTFFSWVEGAKLVELKFCEVKDDPVRPELDIVFRRSYGRKIYGVEYNKEIYAIMCFGFTNEVPKTVKELDLMTRDAYLKSALRDQKIGQIAIAYTVWSKKRGGGKLIVKEVFKMIKKSNHLNRLITLSPLTEMARNFHLNNGATELQINEETQNFEYKI
tara:strand:+ start:672 stop:1268 length:597 start_codon:yes stop_codon:yes gene_type:complete